MDIASLSMELSTSSMQTSIGTAVLAMSLDTIEASGDNTVKMMEQSVQPNLGQTIDLLV